MTNPNMPNMPHIPGMDAMADSLEFVKKLWGSMGIPGVGGAGTGTPGMSGIPGMNIPGIVMPTLSVEEINKKIADLKAVESWLNLNMGMLRSTIQALEVQAATISTLQSMGETFAAGMNAGFKDGGFAGAAAAGSAGGAAGDGARGDGAATGNGNAEGAPRPTSKDQSDAAALTAPLVNAAAWWNMLQDQFKQAVDTAMAENAPATTPATEKPEAARTAAKGRSKARNGESAPPKAPK